MSEIERAFQMLDIIQGHPGYGVECYQCHRPMSDVFGVVDPMKHYMDGVGAIWEKDGLRHDMPNIGMCPVAYFGSKS